MFGIEKPLPLPTEDSEGYWEAANAGKLVVSVCGCGHRFLPPAALCPKCWSDEVSFAEVSGRGTVFSFIVVHRPQHPAFFADAPYNVAIITLDEGPMMHARIVESDEIEVGMKVEVAFEKADDDVYLPVFKKWISS